MHSPPRKVTQKDNQDWLIPPSVSIWKNRNGFTMSLDKRLAADGRALLQPQISDRFASLADALYSAERKAREEVEARAKIRDQVSVVVAAAACCLCASCSRDFCNSACAPKT